MPVLLSLKFGLYSWTANIFRQTATIHQSYRRNPFKLETSCTSSIAQFRAFRPEDTDWQFMLILFANDIFTLSGHLISPHVGIFVFSSVRGCSDGTSRDFTLPSFYL